MVVLGLGSNVGDRLHYLRLAIKHLTALTTVSVEKISPVYLSEALLLENSPPSWNLPYLNLAIRIETSETPETLLLKTKRIEQTIGRQLGQTWGPRPIDIDILAWDNEIIYRDNLHIPHEHLHARPFALWPFSDVAPDWINPLDNGFKHQTAAAIATQWEDKFSGNAPLGTRQIWQRVDGPELMGIINLSPQSFSNDGGGIAVEKAEALAAMGASIIDLGAIATNPRSQLMTAVEEWALLKEPLNAILNALPRWPIPPKISLDTIHPETAEQALALGIDYVNDQSGLQNPRMRMILKEVSAKIIFMHQLGLPAGANVIPPSEDVCKTVLAWARQQLQQLGDEGFDPARLIFDVGIGFGKTASQSWLLLDNIQQFHALGVELLVGHSRKSFLTSLTPFAAPDRDIETLAVSVQLAQKGVAYLRLHNVAMMSRFECVRNAMT